MPLGLSNALTIFQRYVNKILAKKLNIFVIVYLKWYLDLYKKPQAILY